MLNKIKIITPGFNTADVCDKNITSVLGQRYDNFDAIFVIDGSTDGTLEEFKKYIELELVETKEGVSGIPMELYKGKYNSKCKAGEVWVVNRLSRAGAMANWTDAIGEFCEDSDIVVSLDGDDWFLNKKVLTYVNDMYNENDIWVMYGGCTWTDGRKFFGGSSCCSRPYVKADFDDLRAPGTPFKVSMMRTYRAGLYKNIWRKDPELSCFKDKDGNFYQSACDVAMMYPILEQAGFDRIMHNPKPVYVYNRDNVINDDKVDQSLQWKIHAEILKKEPFEKIENYETSESTLS